MDLTARFMGIEVDGPLVVGASPMSDDLDTLRRLEDAGAAAVVLRSLFREQIVGETFDGFATTEALAESIAEAQSFLPGPVRWRLGPDEQLERMRRAVEALDIPVMGSLNGAVPGEWTRYARFIEQTGVAGIELNVYALPIRGPEPPGEVEDRILAVLAEVRGQVTLPVSIKIAPFLTSPIWTARRLAQAGAAGLVLFNRLFPGEIDTEALEIRSTLTLSEPGMLRERLMWIAAIYPHVKVPISASGGVHSAEDIVRAIMAGADTVQMASALLQHGPPHLAKLRAELVQWSEDHEYVSLAQMRGSMSLGHTPDPEAFERAHYIRTLQTGLIRGG